MEAESLTDKALRMETALLQGRVQELQARIAPLEKAVKGLPVIDESTISSLLATAQSLQELVDCTL